MEDAIKRMINRLFPALTAGYHLPRFARVVHLNKAQAGGELCDSFDPIYSVDLEVLDQHGKPDKKIPLLKEITLPTFFAGDQRGFYGKPSIGTWVEVAFAYGSPKRPFIRCILPHERVLTELPENAQRWQQNEKAFMQVDGDGNWQRETDKAITDTCENYSQQVSKIAERLATEKQRLVVDDGGKIFIGNQSDNVLKILEDTITLLGELATTVSTHNHPSIGAPTAQASQFTQHAQQANTINSKLSPIVE